MQDNDYRSPRERRADQLKEKWDELQGLMKGEVLPLIEQAKLLPRDVLQRLHSTYNSLTANVGFLIGPPKPLTPEESAEQEKVIAERNLQSEIRRNKKSDIQECVDTWVKEKLEEFDLKPELLDDDDTEKFDYERNETCEEIRSGTVSFTVSDSAKERIEAGMESDFDEALKEFLDNCDYDDFEIDLENYDSGDMTDSSSTLT